MAETFVAFVNPNFDFGTREEIGHSIIRYIQERTKEGRGIGNRAFRGPDGNNKYSPNYKRSIEFKIAGKEGENTVNLSLTGDMLDSLQIIDISVPGRIEIGFEDGFEDDKARWMKEKGYDFLGLTPKELDSITSDFDTGEETLGSILRGFLEDDETE